jgi:hypothetical protein
MAADRSKQNANLKPIKKGDLSNEELKKRQRNGGKKSGEVRRAQRDAKSAVRYLLNLNAKGTIEANLKELGFPENERTNMAALQARLFTMAMSGNLEAYMQLMKMAGYEPEENRKERESLSSEIRRQLETEAKVAALGGNVENASLAINTSDEDGHNDVVIYLPEIEKEEDCELPPEDYDSHERDNE